MNKSELIEELTKKLTENPRNDYNEKFKQASTCVNIFFNSIKEALQKGEKVEIRGFASFGTKDYKPYTGRNPKTGEQVQVSAKRLPVFKAGKDLRDKLNGMK